MLTIHHPHEPALSEQYARYPDVHYVAIAQWLAAREPMPRVHVVHHGIPIADYTSTRRDKDDYVAFLGRMAPCKGPHLAIEAATKAGVRLKFAGEIQPVFHDYWGEQVLRSIDGDQIQFVGEVDRLKKNALLSRREGAAVPDSVGRAVRSRDDRGDGLRHAGSGVARAARWMKWCATA